MKNSDTNFAWQYHDSTKHSYWSVRRKPHFLDWANMPLPFKVYPDIEPITLPRELPQTRIPTLEAIAARSINAPKHVYNLETLASVLYYSAGITKEKRYPDMPIYFRAAACAGALYPVEVYVVCETLEGLPAGVYHYCPGDHALRRLREGDHRRVLVEATAGESHASRAPVILVFTAITWRSSWKYRERSYRYHYWDAGMIIANALAMANAHELAAQVVLGFLDTDVNRLLGIDGRRELALALLPLGETATAAPPAPEFPELNPQVLPLSNAEVEYPAIQKMHQASSLTSSEEVAEWRERVLLLARDQAETAGEAPKTPLATMPADKLPSEPLEEVIMRRASTRRFAHKALPAAELATILERATRGVAADFVVLGEQLNDIYLIANRVEGLAPGAYFYDRRRESLLRLKEGDFSNEATHLVLDQELGGDASATLFFMVDLQPLFDALGNRAYRAVQLEAGIAGGRAYLASYALRRGATGLTFYDDDVTAFFSPHAQSKSCVFVTALGVPGKPLM